MRLTSSIDQRVIADAERHRKSTYRMLRIHNESDWAWAAAIGIGGDKEAQRSWFGLRSPNRAAQLDEKSLREIAKLTGGRYFRANDTQELAELYALLDELEPIDREKQLFRPISALFYWPLAFALVLAVVVCLLRVRR